MKTATDYPANIPFMTPGEEKKYPSMKVTDFEVDSKRMRKALNLEHLSTAEVQKLLLKMMLPSEVGFLQNLSIGDIGTVYQQFLDNNGDIGTVYV